MHADQVVVGGASRGVRIRHLGSTGLKKHPMRLSEQHRVRLHHLTCQTQTFAVVEKSVLKLHFRERFRSIDRTYEQVSIIGILEEGYLFIDQSAKGLTMSLSIMNGGLEAYSGEDNKTSP